MSKAFGEFKNREDINKTALSLREECEPDQIEILGKENDIPEDIIEKFKNGEIDYLVKTKKRFRRKTFQRMKHPLKK